MIGNLADMFQRFTQLVLLTGLFCLPSLAGCNYLGYAAQALPESDTPAAYKDLKGQKVGILVWADRGIVTDHPAIQPDIAKGLQKKLQEAADAGADEVQKITWAKADDILRFQDSHPELQYDPAEQVAPKLDVTRLIYIEITAMSMHPNDTVDLFRGDAIASIKVVAINNGKAAIAYREDTVEAIYPPHSPPEGMPDLDEAKLYEQTTDTLTTELAKRFISHEPDVE
jgi:hypothetical protein